MQAEAMTPQEVLRYHSAEYDRHSMLVEVFENANLHQQAVTHSSMMLRHYRVMFQLRIAMAREFKEKHDE